MGGQALLTAVAAANSSSGSSSGGGGRSFDPWPHLVVKVGIEVEPCSSSTQTTPGAAVQGMGVVGIWLGRWSGDGVASCGHTVAVSGERCRSRWKMSVHLSSACWPRSAQVAVRTQPSETMVITHLTEGWYACIVVIVFTLLAGAIKVKRRSFYLHRPCCWVREEHSHNHCGSFRFERGLAAAW